MITENLSTLKIHKLSQTQYNRELEAGNIDPTALYLTPDEAITATVIRNALGYTPVNPNSLSLGVHTDGLVYIFVDGTPVGTGVSMSAGNSTT